MCCLKQNVDLDIMVHPKKVRPLEEVSNLGYDRKPMKPKPLEDKPKTSKNTPWHGSKATVQRHTPNQITDGKKIKGTPWSRTKNGIKHSPLPEIKTMNLRSTPLEDIHAAHSRFSEALKHVDGMVETAHRLRLSNQLSDEEARNFTSAFSNMTELLKEWQSFFKTAEGRPRSPQKREAVTLSEVNSPTDTLGVSFSCLDNSISSSPLVPCSLQSSLFCLTPLDRPNAPKRDFAAIALVKVVPEAKHVESRHEATAPLASDETQSLPSSPPKLTPSDNRPVASVSSPQLQIPSILSPNTDSQATHVVSPNPRTPIIISPPRSVHLKGPTPSSGGTSVGTPPDLREHLKDLPNSPPSAEPPTPCIPPELVLRYSRYLGKMDSAVSPSTPLPETPGFGSSPPKTCKPLGLPKIECFVDSSISSEPSTPFTVASKCFETPYATPGSVLPPMTPVSLSRDLTPLVDDITASAIKRMGVRGLEDELWRKLRAWNIDSCLTGRRYVKSRLSFGGSRSGLSNELESIKENCEHRPELDSVSEEGFAVRRRDNLM